MLRIAFTRGDGTPEVRDFDTSSVRIGRDAANDMVVRDPIVSKYHGELRVTERGIVYHDLRSTNGSLVRRGDQLIPVDHERGRIVIEPGDELLLGHPARAVALRVATFDPHPARATIPATVESTLDIGEALEVTELGTLQQLGDSADRAVLLALHHFTTHAAGEREVRHLLEHFATGLLRLLPRADRLTVYLESVDGRGFEPAYAHDRVGETAPEGLSRTLRDLVLDRSRAVLFSASDPEFDIADSLLASDIVNGMCAPLWNGAQTIGLVLVDSRDQNVAPFTLEHLSWLTLFSHQLALGVENARLTTGLFETVDELTCIRTEMEQLAFFDSLTGLHNRRLFIDRLQQAVRVNQRSRHRLAVLYFDLDNFKQINDTLGHDAGDALLRTLSDRLLGCVRNEDTVARIGGDEFAILMSEIGSIEAAQVVASKVLAEFRKPVRIGTHQLRVSASIGITIAPDDGDSAETLLKNADLALYRAKSRGRDLYQFYLDEMNEEITDRLFLQREMWEGLEQAEFVQYFQPVWRLSNASLVGAEVLTRWQHPTRGLLLPEHFIALAEESELIERIGERAIIGACEHLARLRRAGRSRVRLSINLSARQFRGGGLPAIFRRAIEATAVDAADLEVEITETMLMENIRETRSVLEQLKDLGISIAIDDFGVGYSSLGYLKDLPIDVLKVDRSFVQRVETQREDAEIVAAIIAMAHKLHMQVVAEGIESELQRRFLCDNGCDLGQGFLFGAPQPYPTFAAMVPPHALGHVAENTATDWH